MDPAMQASVTIAGIRRGIRGHDLSGKIVVVHSSLASFGTVEGGAAAVVQAFLDEGCTIVVPAFSYWCEVSPPAGIRLERNGGPPMRADRRPARGFSPGMAFPAFADSRLIYKQVELRKAR